MKCLHGIDRRGCEHYRTVDGECRSACVSDTASILIKIIDAIQCGEDLAPDDVEFLAWMRAACGEGET